jgi:hypothetical protein
MGHEEEDARPEKVAFANFCRASRDSCLKR